STPFGRARLAVVRKSGYTRDMDFGIVTAKVDEIGYIAHAENLGYSHCRVTDSLMIRSNCWAVLALGAPPHAPRHRCQRARPPASAGRRRRHRHDQSPGARAMLHRAGHRAHAHAHARAEADEARTLSRVRAGSQGVAFYRRERLLAERRDAPDPIPDARASV